MMILLNDCVQLLTSSRALSAFTWRGQATSLSSCSRKGTMRKWKDRKGHRSGKEQDKSEVQGERCTIWEVKAIGTEERAQSPLGEWWRKWWDLYLKDFGCLREFNLPHIAEGESRDKSGSVILLVGLQTTSLVQWLHVMHLLLTSGLFLLAWDSHQISLHWKTGSVLQLPDWVETARGCECFSQSNGQGLWWDWRCSASMWVMRSEQPDSSKTC